MLGKTSEERSQSGLRGKNQKNHQSQKLACARRNVVHLEKARDNVVPPYSHKWLLAPGAKRILVRKERTLVDNQRPEVLVLGICGLHK